MFNCKLKYVMFSLLCVFISPFIVKADCSYEREAELSRIASNIQLSYTYEIINGYIQYYVNITNVTEDVYIIDSLGNRFSSNKEFVQKYSLGNNKMQFTIYSNDSNCKNEEILTKYLNFPYYNQFSNVPECQQYKELDLCSLWYNTSSYTYQNFVNDLNKTVQNLKTQHMEKEKKLSDILTEMFENYYIYIILSGVGILFLIVVSVIAVMKKVRG